MLSQHKGWKPPGNGSWSVSSAPGRWVNAAEKPRRYFAQQLIEEAVSSLRREFSRCRQQPARRRVTSRLSCRGRARSWLFSIPAGGGTAGCVSNARFRVWCLKIEFCLGVEELNELEQCRTTLGSPCAIPRSSAPFGGRNLLGVSVSMLAARLVFTARP